MLRVRTILLIGAALVLLAACGASGITQGTPGGAATASAPAAVTLATEPVATDAAADAASPLGTESIATGAAASSLLSTASPAVTGTTSVTATQSAMTTTAALAPSGATTGVIRLTLQPDSQVSYRVREQLANRQLPSDAVGTTNAVTGTLVIQPDGKILSDQSKFVVDISTLTSDSRMRDGFIKRSTLQTGAYPQAVFVPTAAQGLPSPLPTSGDVNFKLVGDLTVHGVTKQVSWDVQGKIAGNELSGTATTAVKFEDFGMTPPQAMAVLSVQDNINLVAAYHLTASQQ